MVEWLNPWMLAGLATIAVPVLVHLLSKRRHDVVDWGAMQFLQPSQRQRRALTLENWLLLAVRMLALAIVALALARPWISSPWLNRITSTSARDVVLIVDGSYSLQRQDANGTVHAAVLQAARDVVQELGRGDLIQFVEARERPRTVLSSFTRDRTALRAALADLRPPTSAGNLLAALHAAGDLLLDTGNVQREIVIVTDKQSRSWRLDDVAGWQRWDRFVKAAGVPPRVWVLPVGGDTPSANVSVERLELARESVLPGGLVQLQATLKNWAMETPQSRTVALELNGQPSGESSHVVRIPAGSTAVVDFELRLDVAGCHVLTVTSDSDALPADDRSDVVVEVTTGLDVLLVEGRWSNDPTQRETFFLAAALDPAEGAGRLKPTVRPLSEFRAEDLPTTGVIVLADVPPLDETLTKALQTFVDQGGAVVVTLGDNTVVTGDEPSAWDTWLPARIVEAVGDDDEEDDEAATAIADQSLELSWQQPFRRADRGSLADARFRRWWRVTPLALKDDQRVVSTWASYVNGDPAWVTQRQGRGSVTVATSTLSARWNNLPSRPDYVAWWHELLLSLAQSAGRRNVTVGEPLVSPWLRPREQTGVWVGPFHEAGRVQSQVVGDRLRWSMTTPTLPGLYTFLPGAEPEVAAIFAGLPEIARRDLRTVFPHADREAFNVQVDRGESDLRPLTAEERQQLEQGRPLKFIDRTADLETALFAHDGRTEFASVLLYLFVLFLTLELWLTRRMVLRKR